MSSLRGMLYILSLMVNSNFFNLNKKYNQDFYTEKIKYREYESRIFYDKKVSNLNYYNKTIPRSDKGSRISLRGLEIKVMNNRKKIRRELSGK